MATTTNNSVSPIPLRPKRGIDSNTKNRLERVSKKILMETQNYQEVCIQ